MHTQNARLNILFQWLLKGRLQKLGSVFNGSCANLKTLSVAKEMGTLKGTGGQVV